jgi:hypothetical protein
MDNTKSSIMTKEEFAEKWGIRELFNDECGQWEYIYNSMECLSNLNALLREELIKFCCEKLSPDIIGDEVIFVDEYLKSQQQ